MVHLDGVLQGAEGVELAIAQSPAMTRPVPSITARQDQTVDQTAATTCAAVSPRKTKGASRANDGPRSSGRTSPPAVTHAPTATQ